MRKIGLVTLFSDNYGSELQCFATKTFVERMGYKCDVLFEQPMGMEKVFTKFHNIAKILGCSIRYRGFWKNRREINKSICVSMNSRTSESQFELDWFRDTVLQPKETSFSLLSDKRFQDEYDYFIAGSDQIWNGGYLVSPFMFLEFAEDSKKIALCPSLGVEKLKNFNIKPFRRNLSSFKYLSAREESGVQIIKELTGRTVPRLPDPVMLLTTEEWEDFSESGLKFGDKYILLHFLGKPTTLAINSIKLLSSDYKVICFANPYDELKSIGEISVVSGSPYDYVSLIKNAEYIFTDSFHTSCFSIIFNARFITFEREYGHRNSQSTRIKTLMSVYKCSERYITENANDILKIIHIKPNFDAVRTSENRLVSDYLRKAIIAPKPTQNLKASDECTGCMACLAVCPKNAISVEYSKFGYRIPKVNSELCIHCGLCEKVCNSSRSFDSQGVREAYIAYNLEKELMMKSASGGVFSALAKSFINSGGVVAASTIRSDSGKPVVKHILIDKTENLESVLGSKYVESDCTETYASIAKILNQNGKVLFCGTSCQVKAVYSYLDCKNVPQDKFYTIDLICHGVPGIRLFSDYIKQICKIYHINFTNYQFRIKSDGKINYQFRIKSDGKIKRRIKGHLLSKTGGIYLDIPISESSYYDMFMRQENYREQCYHCEYASVDKPADITIGDYFEAKRDYPFLFTDDGIFHDVDFINCMLVRAGKGKRLLEEYGEKLFTYPVECKRVQLSHRNLCKPSRFTRLRLNAIDSYSKSGICGVEKMHKRIFIIRKARTIVQEIINKALKGASK